MLGQGLLVQYVFSNGQLDSLTRLWIYSKESELYTPEYETVGGAIKRILIPSALWKDLTDTPKTYSLIPSDKRSLICRCRDTQALGTKIGRTPLLSLGATVPGATLKTNAFTSAVSENGPQAEQRSMPQHFGPALS